MRPVGSRPDCGSQTWVWAAGNMCWVIHIIMQEACRKWTPHPVAAVTSDELRTEGPPASHVANLLTITSLH